MNSGHVAEIELLVAALREERMKRYFACVAKIKLMETALREERMKRYFACVAKIKLMETALREERMKRDSCLWRLKKLNDQCLEIRLSVEEPLSAGLRGDEDQLSAKHQLAMKGLSECKASESNIRHPITFETIPPTIPPPFATSTSNTGSPNANRVDMVPLTNDPINTTNTTNVSQSVVDENLPQLLDSRGGSHVTNVSTFDKEDFTSWKVRFLVFLDGFEPYLLKTLEDGSFIPMSSLSTSENPVPKCQNQRSNAKSRLANQDKRLKSIIISCLPNDVMTSVIKRKFAKEMWNDLVLTNEGPFDTRDTKIVALRLKFNAFKSLEGEKVNGNFTKLKCLLNDLEIIEDTKIYYSGLKLKTLISNQQFQDSNSDAEEDQRTSNEIMANLNVEYHERALLANQKRFYKRSGRVGSARKPLDKTKETCFACGKLVIIKRKYKGLKAEMDVLTKRIDDMTKDDEDITKIRAFMAITEDEPLVGKADARSGQWVYITMKKVHRLLSMTDGDERKHVLDYTHVDLHYVKDQRKNLVNKFNLLKQEISLHKSELSNLKNTVSINFSLQNKIIRVNLENESLKDEISDLKKVIDKWTCNKVTLNQLLSEQVPGNIVKALGGKGRRKEKISSKEVVFSKTDESSSMLAPETTSDSESECDIQEPLPSLPKLIGVAPSGTSESLISLSDLTLNMANLTLDSSVPNKTRPSVKVSHTYVYNAKGGIMFDYGFRFGKVDLDPDEEAHSEFRMRVFLKIKNLKGEHLLELVNKDVKFSKLDDEDDIWGLETFSNLIHWWRKDKNVIPRVLRSATKGSSKGKTVHTCVHTEVCHEVHSKEEMIIDLQLRLNSVEEKLKPGTSDVDHLDKTDILSKNALDCGLDQQSVGGFNQCMNVNEPYKNWNDVSDNFHVDGLDHKMSSILLNSKSRTTKKLVILIFVYLHNSVVKEEIVKDDVNVDSLVKEDIEKDDLHVDIFVKEDIEKDDVQFDSVVKDAEQIENGTLPRQKYPSKAYLSPYIQPPSTEVKCRKRRHEIKLEEDVTRSLTAPKRTVTVPEEEKLVGMSHTKRGRLSTSHLDVWIDYLWQFREPNADWAMASPYLCDMLSRFQYLLYYADGVKYGVPWFANNVQKDSHWVLGELHISSGSITIYDSLGGPPNGIETRLFWLELREKLQFQIQLFLDNVEVFEKNNIVKDDYSINFEYADGVPIQGGLYGDCGLWVLYKNIVEEEDTGVLYMEEPTFEQLMDEVDKLKEIMHDFKEKAGILEDSDSDLKLIPDDELRSVSEFQIICEEVSSLHSKLGDMESLIVQQVSIEITSSLPALVTTAIIEQLPGLLLATLKECLPSIIKKSLQTHIPAVSEQFAEKQTKLNKKVVKHLDRQFNISYVAQSKRFVTLKKELSKVLKSEMGQSVTFKVHLDPAARSERPSKITVIIDQIAEKPIRKPVQQLKMVQEFTDQLFGTTSSCFSPTPLKEPTLPRDTSKGKEVATEEPKNELVAYMEDGWSDQKMPKIMSFITSRGTLSQEDFITQLKEIKRANNEDHQRYDPLNLAVYPDFRLIMLGFSEWLKVHSLASKKSGKSYDVLLESLKAKFQWVLDQAKKLGLPPSPELATFGMTAEDKKKKRTELLKEVFVKERIEVDGSQRNLNPPPGVVGKKGLVIREPEAWFFYYNANFDLVFQRELEFHITSTVQLIRIQKTIVQDSLEAKEMYKIMKLEIESRYDLSAKHQLAVKGLSECKASESNIRRIQVKDIIKEVEDYLKTYSSAGMDISAGM
uniref:Ulp1 protease family, C-terminal catalytic domain-containing protein n=1 Tax=Tanacetum cinerariifolium TaxID=118510 RepID=A0A6L2JUY3_TANCI|nr:ulp1 protease family, C-terminal catalytic domain-containing protein [Tanacetum cinerariifolium]